MGMEIRIENGQVFAVCTDHETPSGAQMIMHIEKVSEARPKKRPLVKHIFFVEIRCPQCNKYAEYRLENFKKV